MTSRFQRPPLVATKLAVPDATRAVVRRLTLARARSSSTRRLLLVCAPAGYGKTTLLAEAARSFDWVTAWYRIDVLDHDPVSFIAGLTEAIRARIPGFGEALSERLAALPEAPLPISDMLALFACELASGIDAELHVVVDDYHEAADSDDFNGAIAYVLSALPANVHLAILTRYEPRFPIAKLRLEDQLVEIGVDDLRFDARQATAALAALDHPPLTMDQTRRLLRLTEGWPASIVLASRAVEWLDLDSVEGALADPRLKQDVYSYLAEQVYGREDAATREFLKKTSCLEAITAPLANQIVGITDAHRVLNRLARRHVFTFASAEGSTYRYHNLFREYLRHRATLDDGAQGFADIQTRAAQVLDREGHFEMAMELFLAANEPESGLSTVARAGEPGLDGCRTETLQSWLDRLPTALAASHPWAALLEGQVLMRGGHFDRAVAALRRAEQTFRARNDTWGIYQTLSTLECTLFWKGDLEAAMACCRAALDFATTEEQTAHTLIGLGSALAQECRWAEAGDAWNTAEQLLPFIARSEALRIAFLRTQCMLQQGRFRQAHGKLDSIQVAVAHEIPPGTHAAILNISGVGHFYVAEYERAREFLEAAVACCARFGFGHLQHLVNDSLGQLLVATGDLENGIAHLSHALESRAAMIDAAVRALGLSHLGTAWRRHGEFEKAREFFRTACLYASRGGAPFAELTVVANQEFAVRLISPADGVNDLGLVRQAAARTHLEFVACKCDYFEGALAYHAGRMDEAVERLKWCIPRQLELGHIHFLSQELLTTPDLALAVLTAEDRRETVEGLVDALARHWASAPLLVRVLRLGETPALAALRAASLHRSSEELVTLLERAKRHRLPSVRRAASELRAGQTAEANSIQLQLPELTRREIEVLALMAEGVKNDEITERLVISPATVKTHVNRIFTKLGVTDRVQAVLAYRNRTGL